MPCVWPGTSISKRVGEGARGQYAVAAVTLNRVREKRWPDGIAASYQKKQFSWTISRPISRPAMSTTGRHGNAPQRSRCCRWSGLLPITAKAPPITSPPSAAANAGLDDGNGGQPSDRRTCFFAERKSQSQDDPGEGDPGTRAATEFAQDHGGGLNEPGGAVGIDPVFVSDTLAQVQQGGVRQICGSLHLLPMVNVEAAPLSDRQVPVRSSHRRPRNQNTPSDPWTDPAGTAMERRIRTGARRLTAA